jgi:hypothetical protein
VPAIEKLGTFAGVIEAAPVTSSAQRWRLLMLLLKQKVPIRHLRMLKRGNAFDPDNPTTAVSDSRILGTMEKDGATKEAMEYVISLM